jgi:hypothetical protein
MVKMINDESSRVLPGVTSPHLCRVTSQASYWNTIITNYTTTDEKKSESDYINTEMDVKEIGHVNVDFTV